MIKAKQLIRGLICGCVALVVTLADADTVEHLRCESRVNPTGIDITMPRMSWALQSAKRGASQSAYQILVASSREQLAQGKGNLWDSGKVASRETFNIEYAGVPLAAEQLCFWKVRTWNEKGEPSAWSAPASWLMGLLKPEEWQAQWIGFDAPRAAAEAVLPTIPVEAKTKPILLPPPVYVRTGFVVGKEVKRATLHTAALGLADVYLNGNRVGDDYFASGWTDYTKRVYARSYDVTKMVQRGENALGAIIADGWYSGYVGYKPQRDQYGKSPRVRTQLHLEYADGSSTIIATGPEWKASVGPLLEADFLMGETYDARATIEKWSEPGFNDGAWTGVNVGAPMNPKVEAHPAPPVRAIAEFKAKTTSEPTPGVYVLDLGQNFAGIARLKIKGEAGQKITLRFGERLNPNGTLYTTNLRTARATDTYICRGGGSVETWQPHFTFHGFQYVEVSGLKQKPDADTVVGIALSSDTPVTGSFSCSEPMLNQLRSNIYWTQRMNFIDIPTDCPQRDERLGWTGDAQIYIRTATLNTDVQAFFTKWLVDLADAQLPDGAYPRVAPAKVTEGDGGPAWADAGVICPWTLYDVYGDKRVLARQYPGMVRFIEYCEKRCQPGMLPPEKFQCFGDWLSNGANTPRDVIYLAYFANSVHLTARAAEALGKAEDVAKYRALFEQIKSAFNQAYVGADGRIKGNTQACYVLAIAFDLLDAEKEKLAADYLVKDIEARGWHLSTGFIGTKDLMLALAKVGRNDVAYRLIYCDTFPSWGFSIKNGATSIWERWNGWTHDKGFGDPKMNSFAHYSFGAVYQWMLENIGGIRSNGPAYGRIIIAPQLDQKLTHAEASYDSIRGRIETRWSKQGGQLSLTTTIPPNTTATVFVPAAERAAVTEGGLPADKAIGVKFLRRESGVVVYEVQPGTYAFRSTLLP
ncbi:MAG: glycoside hydrolase family 78 protein [Chthoniobacteraceae bacterium]